MACLSGCFEWLDGIKAKFVPPPPPEPEDDQTEYYALMGWLAEVPLFKKQLSPADLPLIARALKEIVWTPGDAVVKQGQLSEAFYIIKSGKALVVLQDVKTDISTELLRGDFFGARSLVNKAPMPATICAAGPEPLVTMMLSRAEFQAQGLHHKITFPPRPAIDGLAAEASGGGEGCPVVRGPPLTAEEIDFISRCICHNANLRAFVSEAKDKAKEIARLAQKRHVKQGDKVLTAGSLAPALIIVASGALSSYEAKAEEAKVKSAEMAILEKAAQVLQEVPLSLKAEADSSPQTAASLCASDGSPSSLGTSQCSSPTDSPAGRLLVARGRGNNRHRAGSMLQPVREQRESIMKRGMRHMSWNPVIVKVGDRVMLLEDQKTASGWFGRLKDLTTKKETTDEDEVLSPTSPRKDAEKVTGIVVEVDKITGLLTVLSNGRTCKVKKEAVQREMLAAKKTQVSRQGASLGEMSIIYNTLLKENVEAIEASVVYEISRRCFKMVVKHLGAHKARDIEAFSKLLDEVQILQLLVKGELVELARNSRGFKEFKPGEVVLVQGEKVKHLNWYIVHKGQVQVSRLVNGKRESLGSFHRAGHFGERMVLRNENTSDCQVSAGQLGVTCLVLDGDILRGLNLIRKEEGAFGFDMSASVSDCAYKGNKKGKLERRASMAASANELGMDRLEVIKVLGRGGFGAVTLVRDKVLKDGYALKKMSKGLIAQGGMEKRLVAEREIMTRIDNSFLLGFFRSFQDDQFVYFLLELAMGGELLELRRKRPELFEKDKPRGSTIGFYIGCVTLGLQHLHEHLIVYRDLKPENILLTSDGYAKLCDFGFSRFCFRKSHTFLGTPDYMAPEMIDPPHRHDFMVDWWALGVMTYELWTGTTPFCGGEADDPEEQVLAIRRSQNSGLPFRTLSGDCSAQARDFMKRLTIINPEKRLGRTGASELREHPWFREVNVNFEELSACLRAPPYVLAEPPDLENLPALSWRPNSPATPEEEAEADLFIRYVDDGSKWDASF